MGLDINAVQFLIDAHKRGVQLGEVLTLGRQDLNVYPAKMRRLLRSHNLNTELFRPEAPDTMFAEPAFRSLGARRVYSMDASGFEGADFIHDLNQPVSIDLRERFDTVYDGGTLEHVFNFPVALRNCMEMVKVGGSVFIHTVANSYCGHGFYQFSPEMFFRSLSRDNGFEVKRMIMHVVGPYGRWYEVADPESIHSRVELITFCPVQLLVHAQRTSVLPIFSSAPQQSDYAPRWQEASSAQPDGSLAMPSAFVPSRPRLARVFPGLARVIHVAKMAIIIYRTQTLRNRRCFRPVTRP